MSIELTTTCKACGHEWQPDHSDFVAGRWRICPGCRDGPQGTDIETSTKARSGAANGSQRHEAKLDLNREGQTA